MSKKGWFQRTLAEFTPTIHELIKKEHGSWFERVLKAEQREDVEHTIEAFKLGKATIDQSEAVRTYMRQEGKEDLRGMHMWLKAREMTYYDILKKVSP